MLKYEVIWSAGFNKHIKYFQHGIFHRKNSPAFIGINGHLSWYEYGMRHRVNYPALLFDGSVRYYRRGNAC